jgi:glycosyltransferase involved in cell wall biosynthesis
MTSKQGVSVVIPCFNAAEFITQAVESVVAQSSVAARILLVDDGSTDGTSFLLREIQGRFSSTDIQVIRHSRNAGLSCARNTGILAAGTDIIAFLDADDRWDPDFLSESLRSLAAGSLDIVFARGQRFDHQTGRSLLPFDPSQNDIDRFPLSFCWACPVSASGVLTKRDVFRRAGLFDPDPSIVEDIDMWFRVAIAGCRVGWTEKNLHWVRCRPGSLAASDREFHWRVLRTLRRHIPKVARTEDEACRCLASWALRQGLGLRFSDRMDSLRLLGAGLRLAPSKLEFLEMLAQAGRRYVSSLGTRKPA